MRDKLIKLMYSAMLTRENDRLMYGEARLTLEELADYLIALGVTIAEDNNVLSKKKPVVYSLIRGALCPTCDGELDCRFTIKGFWRDKHITARVKSKFCGHCGQPLDWSNEPKEAE